MALYLTDTWSSISGLASVSYGDPSRYPEVAGQVIQQSPVSEVVNGMTASAILDERITIEAVKNALVKEYSINTEFVEYVDTVRKSLDDIAKIFRNTIIDSLEQVSSYDTSLSDVIEYAGLPGISPQSLKNFLSEEIPDLDLYIGLAVSIPGKKLDKLPAGERVDISETVNLGLDHNGVSLTTGYLVPEDYFTGTALPGVGSTADNLPNSIIDSIVQGFVGYGTLELLENLFRPGLSSTITGEDIGSLKNIVRSVAGLGTIGAVRDLTSLGALNPADQAMYNVDLTEIVLEANGYTVYDPLTDSNGDFFDTSKIPDFERQNADPGNGLPYSQRTRSAAF